MEQLCPSIRRHVQLDDKLVRRSASAPYSVVACKLAYSHLERQLYFAYGSNVARGRRLCAVGADIIRPLLVSGVPPQAANCKISVKFNVNTLKKAPFLSICERS